MIQLISTKTFGPYRIKYDTGARITSVKKGKDVLFFGKFKGVHDYAHELRLVLGDDKEDFVFKYPISTIA